MVNPVTYPDHKLIFLATTGNKEAFKCIFNTHRDRIYSIALKFTHSTDAAEDMVQEVFMKLWINNKKLSDVENLTAYLNTMTKNHLLNNLRKVANEQALYQRMSDRNPVPTADLSDDLIVKELELFVQKAIDQLPPQQKKVYHFCRVEGLKHAEVAQKMGIARSTVKGHMVEALSNIRNFLLINGQLTPALLCIMLIQ